MKQCLANSKCTADILESLVTDGLNSLLSIKGHSQSATLCGGCNVAQHDCCESAELIS